MGEAARKLEPGVVCSNCLEHGHNRRSCTNPTAQKLCTDCGKEAKHLVRGRLCRGCYDKTRRPSNGFPAMMTCSFCGGMGHNIRACPDRIGGELHVMSDKELRKVLNQWLSSTTLLSEPRRKLLQEVAMRLGPEPEMI